MDKVGLSSQSRESSGREGSDCEVTTSFFGEDVLLRRLLKTTAHGTYVDVGANHPVRGSNSYGLYHDGWCGLAIDPNPIFADDFRHMRPRDIDVVAGIATEPGSMTYHLFDPDVFNTFCDSQAKKMVAQGRRKLGETTVSCLRLADVISEHLGDRSIDILNVDCEGMDLDVLQSLDFAVQRPTAIVVEDAVGLKAMRDGGERGEIDRFLRSENYSPIAQTAWSAIFVANDWQMLAGRSDAFDRQSMRRGFMPK